MNDQNYNSRLKEYLSANRLVEPESLKTAELKAQKANKSLEEILLDERIMSETDLLLAKGQAFNLPVMDFPEVLELTQEVVALLPQKVATNYQAAVFDQAGDVVKVGLVNPGNFLAHEAINFLAKSNGWRVEYYAISLYDFRRIIKIYEGSTRELNTAIESAEEKYAIKEEAVNVGVAEQFDERVKTAPVAKIVSVIFRNAVEGRASDIHIEPGRTEGRVRYRVDGVLHTSLNLPSYIHSAVVSRIKVLANLRLDETRVPQDGRIRLQMDGRDVDLRISVLPMLNSEKVVIRVLDTSSGVPTLQELGFSDYHIQTLERNIKRPFGVVLLTGPTGSGKTTTLYSILNMLKGDDVNITTLEDPIEYYVQGVNQSQINTDVGFNFSDGLRAILRQDPNIVMVGEIRDNDTAELVVHAGLTGHLVFSTLHTNSAWGAIPRMIDMKAEPFLLSSTLNLVMAQRLVRKVCPDCQKEEKLPPALETKIKQEIAKIPAEYLGEQAKAFKFYKGSGCETCGQTGFVGRTVIGELLEIGQEFRDIIAAEKFQSAVVEKQLQQQKYVSLFQDGIAKALQGLTSIDEIMRVTQM
jgi:type IV pilus assembly protein PilB